MSTEERLAKLADLATEVAFLRPARVTKTPQGFVVDGGQWQVVLRDSEGFARVYRGVICTHIHLTGCIDADAANICNHIKEN